MLLTLCGAGRAGCLWHRQIGAGGAWSHGWLGVFRDDSVWRRRRRSLPMGLTLCWPDVVFRHTCFVQRTAWPHWPK